MTIFEVEPLNDYSTFCFGDRSVANGVHSNGNAYAKEQASRMGRLVSIDFKFDIFFYGSVNNILVSTALC